MPRNGSVHSRGKAPGEDARCHVTIRFYEELNDFLALDVRKKDLDFGFHVSPTVKDAIEAFGVPHVEVDLILVNREPVGFDYRLKPGDRIAVYPVFESLDISKIARLRETPLRRTAFVADVHLRRLARWLRLLGLDVVCHPYASDPELVRISVDESRVLLTRDRALLRHGALTHGYWVRSIHPKTQIVEVLQRFDLVDQVAPFTRCTVCNGRLRSVNKEDARDRIPPKTARWLDEYAECEACGKLYWHGTHLDRVRRVIEEVLSAARSRQRDRSPDAR